MQFLKRYESAIVAALVVMMAVVVLLATVELGWLLYKDIATPPLFLLEINELLELFGLFMLVLIGMELLETVRIYFTEHVIHVEVVLEVGLIAVARKAIILDKDQSGWSLLGIAALIAALAAAYYAVYLVKGRKLVRS